jgi:hypothetical protein
MGHINYYQDHQGMIVTSNGHPRCNYCLIQSHKSEKCGFRRADELATRTLEIRDYPQDEHESIRCKDKEGYPNYLQTEDGKILYSPLNKVLCSYCGIPAHGQWECLLKAANQRKRLEKLTTRTGKN